MSKQLISDIKKHYQSLSQTTLDTLNRNQRRRKDAYRISTGDVSYYANNLHIDSTMLTYLRKIYQAKKLKSEIDILFKGKQLNVSEVLKVDFTSIRSKAIIKAIETNTYPKKNEVAQSIQKTLRLAQAVYRHSYLLNNGSQPTDIIHLGAGGSALGPKLLYTALGHLLPKSSEVYKVHFISNIDGHEIVKATKTLNPASTLVIVNSKSFTTIETLENLKYLKKWKKGKDGEQDYIAITAYPQKALENGIPKGQILSYPLWLGGRYSIFSPVGFILPALFGKKYYLEFLKGAHNHDRHTQKEQAINKSPSVRSALFDYLYHQIIGMPTRTVLIYDSRLELLLSYLQQLEMESNSKSISVDNKKINYSTAPIIWGGVGTDCQHSIFQSLFQGTHTFPSEFITVKKPNHRLTNHHKWLLANARAQQLALRSGYTDKNNSAKNCKGNKPSTHIQLDELTPRALGGLISFYELRVFLYGKLLNINSFDQMGVEFSKPIAKKYI